MKNRSILAVILMLPMAPLASCRKAQILSNWFEMKRLISNERIVAKIGDFSITTSDFKTWVADHQPSAILSQADEATKKRLLEAFLRQRVVLLAAQRAKTDQDPRFLLQVQRFHDSLLMRMYWDKALAPVSEQEAYRYYQAHLDSYSAPDEIGVSQILFRNLKEARKGQFLLKHGTRFEKVARSMSMDSSTRRAGGRMPPLQPSRMPPELEKHIRQLRKGALSEIFESSRGYMIIRNDGLRKGVPRTLVEAKEDVNRQIQYEQATKLTDALLSATTVQIYENALQSVDRD